MTDWRTHISSDPAILGGKPTIRGTRLAVDFLLSLLAEGWTKEQILKNYPALSSEALRAMYAFASETLHDETQYPLTYSGHE